LVITDLNTLLDPSGAGWTLFWAYAINGPGQIVGFGTNALGQTHAFLLTPNSTGAAPLPAALPLFASGLGGLGLLAWRRKRKNPARAIC
jgi:probable HAF family extracellular repeat protein